jgi:predicted Zn finger-like uncharacterized protein
MRITCPNCGAQYEVDSALIPEAGRDVQCSNCGKGWFQSKYPEPELSDETAEIAEPETASQDEDFPPESSDTEPEDVETETVSPTAEAEADIVREDERAPQEAAEPVDTEEDVEPTEARHAAPEREVAPEARASTEADDEDEPGSAVLPPPRPTDENVLAVLREEAERELSERRREAAVLETQGDLGLAEPVERSPVRATAEAAAVGTGARRDLLPDIDEINSTLRSDTDRTASADEDLDEDITSERRRGFRLGFGLMILLAAALIALYVGAGWLAAAVPALEPFLIAYVGWANSLFAWFDGLLAAGVDGMSGLMAPAPDAS